VLREKITGGDVTNNIGNKKNKKNNRIIIIIIIMNRDKCGKTFRQKCHAEVKTKRTKIQD
jgi:hypothetical protein